jgi:hypothetical protein
MNTTKLFDTVTGSQAYGTATPLSDIDTKAIHIAHTHDILIGEAAQQYETKNPDHVSYELGRYLHLASTCNPNIVEMLYCTPTFVHGWFQTNVLAHRDRFLTQQARRTFGGYAVAQIKKARGQNKKIVNPMTGPKQTVENFCYIVHSGSTKPVLLADHPNKHVLGLTRIKNMSMFAVHLGSVGCVSEDGNNLLYTEETNSFTEKAAGYLYFNHDGWAQYQKAYAEYQDWVVNRNPNRILNGEYDSKNMMHTFRLLHMAKEILSGEGCNVHRPDAEWLLEVRSGKFSYDDLVVLAEQKLAELDTIVSPLPETVDPKWLRRTLLDARLNL